MWATQTEQEHHKQGRKHRLSQESSHKEQAWNYSGVVSNTNTIFTCLIWNLALFKHQRKLGEKPYMRLKIYIHVYTETPTFSHFFHSFSPRETNQTKEKHSLFFLKSLYLLWSWQRSPSWGLDSRRQTSLSLTLHTADSLPMEHLEHGRERSEEAIKSTAHLTYALYTRASVFPNTFTLRPLLGS